MNTRSILIAAVVAAAGTPAFAAPHEGGAFVHDYDSDHDGQVTRAEFDAVRVARFKATDANGDGWVSDCLLYTSPSPRDS